MTDLKDYIDGGCFVKGDLPLIWDFDTPIYAISSIITNPDTTDEEAEAFILTYLVKQLESVLNFAKTDKYIMFIGGKGNFRKDLDPRYKSNRGPVPKYLNMAKEIAIRELGAIECNGYEADDAVITFSRYLKLQNVPSVIVTSDKDLKQLPDTLLIKLDRGSTMRVEYIPREEAEHNLLVQVMMGDTTDNIAALPGVGEGTAGKVLAGYYKKLPDWLRGFDPFEMPWLFTLALFASYEVPDKFRFDMHYTKAALADYLLNEKHHTKANLESATKEGFIKTEVDRWYKDKQLVPFDLVKYTLMQKYIRVEKVEDRIVESIEEFTFNYTEAYELGFTCIRAGEWYKPALLPDAMDRLDYFLHNIRLVGMLRRIDNFSPPRFQQVVLTGSLGIE